jgi:PAS domain S-box-containing protein
MAKKNQFKMAGSGSYEAVLKQATTEKVSFFSISKIYPAYITLLITLGVTIGLWQLVDSQVENDRNTSFDKSVTSVMHRFEGEYLKNNQVLTSVSGLYGQLVQVVRDYFDLYASIPTKTIGSLTGVVFAPRVPVKDLSEYYYNTRSQGLWEYIIFPEGNRDTYYPIQFIVPAERNNHLSGFDYGTIPVMKQSMLSAMKENKTVSTPIFEFRKDTATFFLITPVYKKDVEIKTVEQRTKHYDGAVMLEIDAKSFFVEALGTGNQSDSTIIFQVFNVGAKGEKDIIFKSKNVDLLTEDYEPELQESRTLRIADKDIKVQFYTIPNFGGSFAKFAPILTLVVSLLLSALAFAFIVNVINRKQSALSLAERMTRSQRRIVESSNDIIAVMDLEGVWKSMNPASTKILMYEPDEMVNQKIDTLFEDSHDLEEFNRILNEPSENLTQKMDVKMLNKNGETRWVSWSLSVSRIEGLVYTTGRDVTLEKINEEQDRIRNKQIMLAEQLSREASEFKSSFFAKLSLQLRNSLTGILGYLDLISFKAYESDEERDSYIDEASKSSQEILRFVMDTSDTWGISDAESSDSDALKIMTAINLSKPVNEAMDLFNHTFNKQNNFKLLLDNSIANSIAVVETKHLIKTINDILHVLCDDVHEGEISVKAKTLEKEDTTQLIITVPKSTFVSEMIDVFNKNVNNLIDVLKKDRRDMILRFALSASNFRMVNGKMQVISNPDNNQVIVNMHNKVQQEEKV